MSSKHLLAATLLAGTMFTPVAGTARDRGDNDFSAVSQPDDEDDTDDEGTGDEDTDDEGTDDEGTDDEGIDDEGTDEDNITDLDDLSQEDLDQELTDELDDIFDRGGADNPVSLQQAFTEVMYALSDAGDDASESIVDFDELEAEMEEAGTSLEQEVWNALNEADEYVSRPTPGIYKVASRDVFLAASDGMTTRRAVFAKVKPRLTRVIRAN